MLTRNEYDILVVTLAWVGGFLPIFLGRRMTWIQGVGLALLLTPFVRMGINVYLSVGALFTYTVLDPVAEAALWRSVGNRLLHYLVVPGLGLLLLHNAVPFLAHRRTPRGTLRDALHAHGLAPRRSWTHDALRGSALFFAIAIAYVGALLLSKTALASLAANGDESAYWRNITVPLIVLLSATAGLTEEFLFRGVLLVGLTAAFAALARRLRGERARRLLAASAFPLAALVQGLFFALTHSGYGTWMHVAGPLAFGLGMAWVARIIGILPAALLHAQVNVLFFTFDVWPAYVGAHGTVGLLTLSALVLALALASAYALHRTRADAVRLLWKSLTRGLRDVPDEGPRAAR